MKMISKAFDWIFGTQPDDDLTEGQHRRIRRDDQLREAHRKLQLATGEEPSTREIWAATPPVLRDDIE